jgi:MSHA pilin protein MshC
MRRSGFTLVELVTTLVIVGLLTAVAAPRFFDHQPFNARGYADELAGALHLGRQVALASECPVQVVIGNDGSYSLWQRAPDVPNNTCTTAGAWAQPVLDSHGSAVAASAPHDVGAGPAVAFVIQPDGTPDIVPPVLTVDMFQIALTQGGEIMVTP